MKYFDGAFGTYYNKIQNFSSITELANIDDKKTVLKIHEEYIACGVNYIETNTYNANFKTLPKDKLEEVIKNGYTIAKEAIKDIDITILSSIGYTNDNAEEYIKIIDYFLEVGSNNFIFESFPSLDILTNIISYIKEKIAQSFIVVSFSIAQDGYSETGEYYKDLISKSYKNKDIDLIGLNCSIGPSQYISLIKKLNRKFFDKLLIMPNANYPVKINNRLVFENNSDYYSDKMLEIYNLGIENIGGCCGTTPEHIKKTIEKIEKYGKIKPSQLLEDTYITTSNISTIDGSHKLIAVELDSPINHDFSQTIDMAKKLKEHNVDFITIADSPLAKTRMDSLISGIKLKRDLKVDVIPHINCRDKNTIGIKAGVLGAVSEDISNVLIITGDPIVGRKEKGVFELNSFNMISYISSLNKEIFPEKPLTISAALNINSNHFHVELKRATKKIEMGASILFTQPIYEETAIKNLKLAKEVLNIKIFGGILPVASYGNGMFLNNEVSGINIPLDILEKLNNPNKEEVKKITIEYSKSIIDKIYSIVDGFYIMIPVKKIDLVLELIDYIKEKEKNGN